MATKHTLRPTKKQRELLGYIETSIAEHGYSPSYREIMRGLNYTSVATVALHINSLIKRGHLRKREHSARSLEVVKAGDAGVMVAIAQPQPEDHEQWLAGRIQEKFKLAEKKDTISSKQLKELHVLVDALDILGLDEAADSFASRLVQLKGTEKAG